MLEPLRVMSHVWTRTTRNTGIGELSICTCWMGRQLYFEVMYVNSFPNSLSQNFSSIPVTCAEYYVPKQSPVLYVKMLSANCVTVFSVYCGMKYFNIFLGISTKYSCTIMIMYLSLSFKCRMKSDCIFLIISAKCYNNDLPSILLWLIMWLSNNHNCNVYTILQVHVMKKVGLLTVPQL